MQTRTPARPDVGVTKTVVEPARAGGLDAVVRVRLDLGYDGTAFAGWARQPGRRTVQGVVEDALATVLRVSEPPALTVAGRTDAGVHARGQVAHFDLALPAWLAVADGLHRRLAGTLPVDVRVTWAGLAPAGFDARFGALWRRYAYRVTDELGGVDPLHRHDILEYARPLDVDRLNLASEPLVGHRDFAAFCRRREGATTLRTLLELSWLRQADGTVVATVRADAFCHSMVRALVGSLLPVGDGRKPLTWPTEVLAAGVRESTVNVVAALGLTLEEVAYPPDDDLAAQADLTRRRRA
jgi:tRNA pseudouridine38-40 synthase